MANTKEVFLVTGASTGIGLEMTRILAARGCDLVLVSRNAEKLEALARALRSQHGVTVHVCPVDLSVPGSADRVAHFTREQGIVVDGLVNNAGVGLYGDHLTLDPDALCNMLQLNITSLAQLCQLYGREFKQRRRGRILNVASTAAYQPSPYFAAYGASKTFVLHFSEALAKELEDHGVTVSCLSPGPTDTGFFSDVDKHAAHVQHFDKSERADARTVARIGIETMMAGRLSRIVGTKNNLRAWSTRLAPRSVVARFAKRLLKPSSMAQLGAVTSPADR